MYSRKTEKQRGRLETREYYYTEETEWLIKRKEVKGIRCINFNNRRKWKKAGTEKVLHNEYSRGSGRICKSGKKTLGNRKLNMTFREDASRTLNKNVARNLNILRKLAISILEELPFRKKFSRRIKRYIISLDIRRYLKLFFDI